MNKINFESYKQWLEEQERVDEVNQAISDNSEAFEEIIVENSYFDVK